ncbi:TPA: molybdenum cofactor guanylyltransferase MobA [Burkholderia territorii]|uniref:molybdenum cofactor guanylyltransferase MobA n=1 Tax=Burkholderia territorii TaxID=1503055 RepID=UPI0011CAD8C6|nr:molybdenum cofactor guanylyltransferase MobA [Burkholderia territorii]TXG23885.1 molybdenum cofactor guanylyltransferase MobA [Burkholderia territorii]HDR8856112.1 molybdenum cofactor guanylyltransferase MobA [Burkholderia territorii]HDR8863233.1 molybdenum cofactor guanylyltransferase MobA [Burkholderia territorii]HDR8869527.1 molybdenum cofactor guanylyltransferase MobA [Burkholderia territorii]HDR8876424.1 molybdenum cofactor guanylyltransferase MobA [Burkholderia territorii]
MSASASPSVTGLLLAGGRATRMGGADKGLQLLDGTPLALHVLRRLSPQVDEMLISANRNADRYAELGAPFDARIVPDDTPDFPGPLAGLLAGMRAARAPLVACSPCDTPYLPTDLVARLLAALDAHQADIAMAVTVDAQQARSPQPTCALLRTSLADDLAAGLAAGERKVRAWYARHKTVEVEFCDERAFYNANSWQELAALARR